MAGGNQGADSADTGTFDGTRRTDTLEAEELTEKERDLIRLWRNTDDRGRDAIMDVAEFNQGWDDSGTFRIYEGGTLQRCGGLFV